MFSNLARVGIAMRYVPRRDPDGNVMTDGDSNVIHKVLLDAEDIHKALLERNQ
jgi:hypothetical protein